DFARAFERGDIAPQDFHHRDHLRLAWTYLGECRSTEDAVDRVAAGIRRFAAAAGASEKYHQTLTVFWTRALVLVRAALPDGAALEEALHARSGLLDKDLPLTYYSRERLFSDEARRVWVEPAVRPLD